MKALTRKEFIQGLKIIVLAVILSIGIGTAHAVWTPPAGAPPTCPNNSPGCEAPLHIGTDGQTKQGGLSVALGQPLGNLGFAVLNGNVGIGTGVPGAKLHVSGGANQPGGAYSAIRLTDTNVPNATWEIIAQTNNKKMFRIYDVSNNVDRLSINALGNVGIGTQAPVQKLDVVGYIQASNGFCIGTSCITAWPTGGTNPPPASGGLHVVHMSHWPGTDNISSSPVESMGTGDPIFSVKLESATLQQHVYRIKNISPSDIRAYVSLFASGVPQNTPCDAESRTSWAPKVFFLNIPPGAIASYSTETIKTMVCELNSAIQVTAETI